MQIAAALHVGAQRQLTRHRSSRRPRTDSDNNLSSRTFTACLIDAGTAIPIKAGRSRAPRDIVESRRGVPATASRKQIQDGAFQGSRRKLTDAPRNKTSNDPARRTRMRPPRWTT